MGLIYLREALMAGRRLPYDAEVEFLESSGTQYIDTLANADSNLSVEITMANAGTPWTNINPIGAILVLTSAQTRHHLNFVGSGMTYYYGNVSNPNVQTRYKPDNLVPFTFKVDSVNKTFTLDGYSTTLPTYAFDTGLSYWLFGRNGTTPPHLCSLRIYSAKLWNGTTLVRDFIPVRKGTVGYLYDRVSGRLFGNAGTGDFVLGQDVVPVEYIESHGTEWIDTGVVGNSSTKVEIKAQGTNTSVYQALSGCRDSNGLYSFAVWQRALLNGAYGMRWDYLATNTGVGSGYVLDGVWNTSQPNLVVKDGVNNYLNGVQLGANASNSFSCNFPLALFAMNTGGSKGNFFVGKMFMCKIFNNNTPTRDYKAIRVGSGSTWEGAMMDVLTRRIYRNAGTGAFTYGNDLKYPIPAE